MDEEKECEDRPTHIAGDGQMNREWVGKKKDVREESDSRRRRKERKTQS